MKLFGITIKFVKRTLFQDVIWGIISCIVGIGITSFVCSVSNYYSKWFFALCTFVFGVVIMFRFEKNWYNLWSGNKKRKKKKIFIKESDLKI